MEVGTCTRFPAGWWTYEFCYKRLIRQFHEGEGAVEHILGRYRARHGNGAGPLLRDCPGKAGCVGSSLIA